MFVPEKLKVNRFKDVKIPTNKDFFARVGLGNVGVAGNYTGDEMAIPAQSKIDQIRQADFEYSKYLNQEVNKSE